MVYTNNLLCSIIFLFNTTGSSAKIADKREENTFKEHAITISNIKLEKWGCFTKKRR